MFKEAEIQAIGLKLHATKKEKRESKSEREKENAGFACQEDLKFEGGKTMRYEFEKLQVTPVSGEMRERERFLFLFFFTNQISFRSLFFFVFFHFF